MANLMTAEEAYKISMSNIPEQVENLVKKMSQEILHSCDLGYTWAKMHVDPRLGRNPAFLTGVHQAFEEKNYQVYLEEKEENSFELTVFWEPFDLEDEEEFVDRAIAAGLENAKAI